MSFRKIRLAAVAVLFWSILAGVPATYATVVPDGTLVRAEINPAPALEPEEVTRIQLEALQTNSPENEGIALTYRFASPDNRKVTGPLPRFVAMVRSPPYDRLLNHRHVEFGPVGIVDKRAYQPIMVTDADGGQARYLWILSRQDSGEFQDCWMTDAVISPDETVPRHLAFQDS